MRELNTKEVAVVSGGVFLGTIGKTLDTVFNSIFNTKLTIGETVGNLLDAPFKLVKNIISGLFPKPEK